MRLLAEHEGNRAYAHTVKERAIPALPFKSPFFPCLIWHHGKPWPENDMLAFADKLIEAGCRNAVCVGPRNSRPDWEIIFDMAWVARYLDAGDDIRDANTLLTSQHDDECADDVAFWFIMNTCFDYHWFHDFLLLHIGTGPDVDAVERAVVRCLQHDFPSE